MTQVINAPMPIQHDLRMKKGADWRTTIFAKADDRVTPKDTTGWTVTMTIRECPNGEIYDTLTIGSGITNTPAAGKLFIKRTASIIDTYDWTRATYDIIITDAGGEKTCPFYGDIEVIQ